MTDTATPFLRAIRRFAPAPEQAPRRWVVVFYDQLRPRHPLLGGPPGETGVLYLETTAKPARRRYHAQKLVLLLSAMRHDAEARGRAGHPVRYHVSDAWYDAAIGEARDRHGLTGLHALEPAEAEVREPLRTLPWLTLHPNTLWATDDAFYRRVFPRPGTRRLETFYRAARSATGLLMDGRVPVGGAWNYDAENRRAWQGDPPAPPPLAFTPDAITREVMALVAARYPASLGSVEGLRGRSRPIRPSAPWMRSSTSAFSRSGRSRMPWRSARQSSSTRCCRRRSTSGCSISLALCRRVEAAYRAERCRWRRPKGSSARCSAGASSCGMSTRSTAGTTRRPTRLARSCRCRPGHWGAPSGLHCLDTTVADVLARGYSHHITRLMVLSNIATLLGVDPHALNRWFWEAYVDAYEWVVTPNVVGMATWADGGIVGSKPYVSSGKAHPANGAEPVRGVSLRPACHARARCVSAQPSLLGLPGAPPRPPGGERPDGRAAGGAHAAAACRDGGPSRTGGGMAGAGAWPGWRDGRS
ncbi:MAG: cryptochrome/photolyase family protein [Vicinamibacterales bacterium]